MNSLSNIYKAILSKKIGVIDSYLINPDVEKLFEDVDFIEEYGCVVQGKIDAISFVHFSIKNELDLQCKTQGDFFLFADATALDQIDIEDEIVHFKEKKNNMESDHHCFECGLSFFEDCACQACISYFDSWNISPRSVCDFIGVACPRCACCVN